ncbi:MAG: S8 family serine peptidase [Thermoguttaceae bacterium]|nr:S8 family serine peptidase [Thermoguttaceae bacterium]
MMRKRRLLLEALEQRLALDSVGMDADSSPPWQRVIVTLKEDTADPVAIAQGLIRGHGGALGHTYVHALKGFSAQLPSAAIQALQKNPQVKFIEPDLVMQAFGQQTVPTGVNRIDAEPALRPNIDLSSIDIAIIDTGIDTDHPELNVAGGIHYYSVTSGPPKSRGSFADGNYDDDNGHGTHVAGIAAAEDNDEGVVGVAPGARLWAVKVLDSAGYGSLSDVIKGVEWVTEHSDEIEIVNMSLGVQGTSPSLRTSIQTSVAKGIVYVVAAGNEWRDVYGADKTLGTSDDTIPAAYPEVATISAMSDSDGQPGGLGADTSWGDYGKDDAYWHPSNNSSAVDAGNPVYSPGGAIDLMMPGADIYSTYMGGGYATMSGTSMAAPHAAGLAALHIAAKGRDFNGDGAVNAADVYALRQAMINGAQAWRSPLGLYHTDGTIAWSPDAREESLGWAGVDFWNDFPTVAIVSPEQGAVLSGSATIVANAQDDWRVDKVVFAARNSNGAVIEIAADTNGDDGWSASWNTPQFADGSYILTATAYDSANQATTSAAVAVVVNNLVSTFHVADLDGTASWINKNSWRARVSVKIVDTAGSPLVGATVYGKWSNSVTVFSGITDANGWIALESSSLSKTIAAVSFTVTDVRYSTWTYRAEENADPDGDSSGTTITVSRPVATAAAPRALYEELALWQLSQQRQPTESSDSPAVRAIDFWMAYGP